MRVTVLCFGAMRDYLPDPRSGRAEIDVGSGATVGTAIDNLGASGSLIHSVLVDGHRAELGHELHDGAEVTLMPPFAGGSTMRS